MVCFFGLQRGCRIEQFIGHGLERDALVRHSQLLERHLDLTFRRGSRGGKMPFWVTMWIDGSQLLFLGVSIVAFSAGLICFSFASDQVLLQSHCCV
jgi:hypothetical protein